MTAVIELGWTFSPPDYFGEQRTFSVLDCEVVLEDGRGLARVDAARYESEPTLRQRFHESVENYFLTDHLMRKTHYDLSGPGVTKVEGANRTVQLEAMTLALHVKVRLEGVIKLRAVE